MQPDVMFPNDPVESREQMLRDNCDQIEQRSFLRALSPKMRCMPAVLNWSKCQSKLPNLKMNSPKSALT